MNPARNFNRQEATEEGCNLCGFMKPDFKDGEEVSGNSRELRGTATILQQHPRRLHDNNNRSLFNIEYVYPEWLGNELERFQEARNSGKFRCWKSISINFRGLIIQLCGNLANAF
jgi:hypothetical protein